MTRLANWEPYDPAWLVELAREQLPDEAWLPGALALCTRCRRESRAYIDFVDPGSPNQPGSAWRFDTNLQLESPTEGCIVLDVLVNHRVGGVEFVDKI